ncbi:MAG TPA: hypothetical protein VMV92_35110 [Streptosporangiaceae bacterium]|nr:hypothetical protein [Streptosporangiaceae bacterium]
MIETAVDHDQRTAVVHSAIKVTTPVGRSTGVPVRQRVQAVVDGGDGGRRPGRAAHRPGRVVYRIHPALPGYLAAGSHAADPSACDPKREASEQALLTA